MSLNRTRGPDRTTDNRAISFLRRGPLQRWKGRWRFGLAWIGDDVVARLVAAGRAVQTGETVQALAPVAYLKRRRVRR